MVYKEFLGKGERSYLALHLKVSGFVFHYSVIRIHGFLIIFKSFDGQHFNASYLLSYS